MTIEPSRQNWIKDAPDSRIYGTREAMEARIVEARQMLHQALLYRTATPAKLLAYHYGMTLAHWGLALLELEEKEAAK